MHTLPDDPEEVDGEETRPPGRKAKTLAGAGESWTVSHTMQPEKKTESKAQAPVQSKAQTMVQASEQADAHSIPSPEAPERPTWAWTTLLIAVACVVLILCVPALRETILSWLPFQSFSVESVQPTPEPGFTPRP